MYGIFINEDEILFARLIAAGLKRAEIRSRNMLKNLVGERVAIISTSRKHKPEIVGYADIVRSEFCPAPLWGMYRADTLVLQGSKYDCKEKGKYLYWVENAEECEPYPLPDNAVRHGRSYAEF